jgi:predicted CxxxxCH...CXXCH cytochrome family protein
MGRVAFGTAAAAALALAACSDTRVAETPLAGESSCASCHTAPGEGPPFRDQNGNTDPHLTSVGAHDAHLHADIAPSLTCGACHIQPDTVSQPGHLDTPPPGNVVFGPLARTGSVSPVYDGKGCAASYCHGNFPGGNRGNTPKWTGGPDQANCGSCHGIPPPSGRHPEHLAAGVSCDKCHGAVLVSTHLNGTVDIALTTYDRQFKTCTTTCHAPRSWPAPGDATR